MGVAKRRKKRTLRRKCDHCDIKFYSHFCLLLHLKTHCKAKNGWFHCSVCKKLFGGLARFIRHCQRHLPRRKFRTLRDKGGKSSEISSHNGGGNDAKAHCEITEEMELTSEQEPETGENSDSIMNGEKSWKVFEAEKFLNQLKAFLKLDDAKQLPNEGEDVSWNENCTLQVSEVTSSNTEQTNDAAECTSTEVASKDTTARDITDLERESAREGSTRNEVNGDRNGSCATQLPERGRKQGENGTEISNNAATASGDSGEKDGFPPISLPMKMYSCSMCEAKFASNSRVKRHERAVHKLHCAGAQPLASARPSHLGAPSYQCTFCFEKADSIKSLDEHMQKYHKIRKKIPKSLLALREPKNSETETLLGQDAVDILEQSYLGDDSGLLTCSLCDASFLTYGGQRRHLRAKHNINFYSVSSEEKRDVRTKNGKRMGVPCIEVHDPSSEHGEKDECLVTKEDAYDSDTNTKCRKCGSVFKDVKKRRNHAVKAHGLRVSFDNEKRIFFEFAMKANGSKTERTSPDPALSKQSKLDCDGKYLHKRSENSCKLCHAKYMYFSSLQRHMVRKHNIRVYRFLRDKEKATSTPSLASELTSKESHNVAGSVTEDASNVSGDATPFAMKRKREVNLPVKLRLDKPEMAKEEKNEAIGAAMSLKEADNPIKVIRVIDGNVEKIQKRTCLPTGKMFLYKLDRPQCSVTKSEKLKLNVYKLQRSSKVVGFSTDSQGALLNVGRDALGSIVRPVGTTKSVSRIEKAFDASASMLAKRTLVSPESALLSTNGDKMGVTSQINETESLSKQEAKQTCIGTSKKSEGGGNLINPEQVLQVEKRDLFVRNEASSSSEEVRTVVESSLSTDSSKKSMTTTEKQLHDKNGDKSGAVQDSIDNLLWKTNIPRKKFVCLICDVSFSGYHIQKRHMLRYHEIQLDNQGNRIAPMAPNNGVTPQNNNSSARKEDLATKRKRPSEFCSTADEVVCDSRDSPIKRFECDEISSRMDTLLTIKTEDGGKRYLCSYCPSHFESLIDRHIHINEFHKDPIRKAGRASDTLQAQEEKSLHPNRVEVNRSRQGQESAELNETSCKQKDVKRDDAASKGSRSVNDSGIFPCHLCNKIYRHYRSVRKHVINNHKAVPMGFSTDSVSNPNWRSQEGNIKCQVCKRVFWSYGSLNVHMNKCEGRSVDQGVSRDLPDACRMEDSNSTYSKYRCDIRVDTAWTGEKQNVGVSKQPCELRRVRSSLLAISVKEEPVSEESSSVDNQDSTMDTAQPDGDRGFSPVPPCDETELIDNSNDSMEHNVFSRLEGCLLSGKFNSKQPVTRVGAKPPKYSDGFTDRGRNRAVIGEGNGAVEEGTSSGDVIITDLYTDKKDLSDAGNQDKSTCIERQRIMEADSSKEDSRVNHIPDVVKLCARNKDGILDSRKYDSLDSRKDDNLESRKDDNLDSRKDDNLDSRNSDDLDSRHSDDLDSRSNHSLDSRNKENFCSSQNGNFGGKGGSSLDLEKSISPLPSSSNSSIEPDYGNEAHILPENGTKFICTIPGCGMTFATQDSYENHVRATCTLCHKQFTREPNVKRHLREVHKVNDILSCDCCGKEFAEPISLAIHNKVEHMASKKSTPACL